MIILFLSLFSRYFIIIHAVQCAAYNVWEVKQCITHFKQLKHDLIIWTERTLELDFLELPDLPCRPYCKAAKQQSTFLHPALSRLSHAAAYIFFQLFLKPSSIFLSSSPVKFSLVALFICLAVIISSHCVQVSCIVAVSRVLGLFSSIVPCWLFRPTIVGLYL